MLGNQQRDRGDVALLRPDARRERAHRSGEVFRQFVDSHRLCYAPTMAEDNDLTWQFEKRGDEVWMIWGKGETPNSARCLGKFSAVGEEMCRFLDAEDFAEHC
jgi:hypothetical protein